MMLKSLLNGPFTGNSTLLSPPWMVDLVSTPQKASQAILSQMAQRSSNQRFPNTERHTGSLLFTPFLPKPHKIREPWVSRAVRTSHSLQFLIDHFNPHHNWRRQGLFLLSVHRITKIRAAITHRELHYGAWIILSHSYHRNSFWWKSQESGPVLLHLLDRISMRPCWSLRCLWNWLFSFYLLSLPAQISPPLVLRIIF